MESVILGIDVDGKYVVAQFDGVEKCCVAHQTFNEIEGLKGVHFEDGYVDITGTNELISEVGSLLLTSFKGKLMFLKSATFAFTEVCESDDSEVTAFFNIGMYGTSYTDYISTGDKCVEGGIEVPVSVLFER